MFSKIIDDASSSLDENGGKLPRSHPLHSCTEGDVEEDGDGGRDTEADATVARDQSTSAPHTLK